MPTTVEIKGLFMNTPNNRRRRASIERIEKVFLDMVQQRELNRITVAEICKRAGLNRTTFYANYADVYALADSIRDRLEGEVDRLYAQETEKGFNSNDYLRLFRHIRENQMLYRTYFKLGYDQKVRIVAYDTELARRHFQNRFVEYHMEFFRYGLNRIITMWLDGGCRETPEEMFEIVQSEYRGREGLLLGGGTTQERQ